MVNPTFAASLYTISKDGENTRTRKVGNKEEEVFIDGYQFLMDMIQIAEGDLDADPADFVDEDDTVTVTMNRDGKEAQVACVAIRPLEDLEIIVGLQKVLEPGQQEGSVFEKNEIKCIADAVSGMTVQEAIDEVDEPAFLGKWRDRNKGNTYDKTKGAGAAPKTAKKKTASFGKKS